LRWLVRCLDSDPALAGNAWNYFSLVGEYHCFQFVRREISTCRPVLSNERKLPAVLHGVSPTSFMPALEFAVKVGQLVDGIGAADFDLLLRAKPRKSLFKQMKHPLDKCPRRAIFLCQRITSIVVVKEWLNHDPMPYQPKRLSCTGAAAAGQGVSLISTLMGSTR